MSDFMVELGCKEAFDLDGGQSTTLLLNGKLINRPVQGVERNVANGIAVMRKRPSDPAK